MENLGILFLAPKSNHLIILLVIISNFKIVKYDTKTNLSIKQNEQTIPEKEEIT